MICFHSPEDPYNWLSNWYFSDFVIDGFKYSSMEQFMMHQKALLFKDSCVAEKIMKTSDFKKIKSLGRKVQNFKESVWIQNREIIVIKGLTAKFTQNEDLKELLLNTGDETLVECAVKDKIWGIGLSLSDEKRLDQTKWKGQNLLGNCLMTVRSTLRK